MCASVCVCVRVCHVSICILHIVTTTHRESPQTPLRHKMLFLLHQNRTLCISLGSVYECIYVCVCPCVCVCMFERKGGREKRDNISKIIYVPVHTCAHQSCLCSIPSALLLLTVVYSHCKNFIDPGNRLSTFTFLLTFR